MRSIIPILIRFTLTTIKKTPKILQTQSPQQIPSLNSTQPSKQQNQIYNPSIKATKQQQIYNICQNLRIHHNVLLNNQALFIEKSYVLNNIDFNTCKIQTLASVFTVMPEIDNHKQKYLKRLLKEADNIDGSQPMSNNLLLSYLILFQQLTNYLLYMKFLNIFDKQFHTLEKQNYEKFIWLMNKRKIPDKIQIKMFEKWKRKVKTQIKNMSLINVINIFNVVVPMNDCLWDIVDLLIVLQNRIYEKIKKCSLNEEQLTCILGYKCELNIFRHQILKSLVASIDENGTTPHQKQLQLFINEVGPAHRLVLSNQNTKLLFRFIEKRLDNPKLIINTIQSYILPRQYQKRLIQLIQHSDLAQNYKKNEINYQIIRRGLHKPQQYKKILEEAKQKIKKAQIFSDQFLMAANIVDSLLFNDGNNFQITLYRKEIQQLVQNYITNLDLTNYIPFNNRGKYGRQFLQRYSMCILKNIVPKVIENNCNISDGLLFDIIFSGNQNSLSEILSKCPSAISQRQIYLVLSISQLYPQYFFNSYSLVSILLQHNIKPNENRIRMIRKVLYFICNQQIQSNLNKFCLKNYLLLVRKFIKVMKLKQLTNSFITYLVDSKTLNVRYDSLEFLGILKDLQTKVIQNSTPENIYVLVNLIQELIKINKLNTEYAQKILKRTNKFVFVSHMQEYLEFVANYNQEYQHKKIINLASDMIILVKSKYIKQQQLLNLIQQCKTLIDKLHYSSLQTIIASYELPPNKTSIKLANMLLDRYIDTVIAKKSKRIHFAVQRAQYLYYRGYITIQKYKELANKSFGSPTMKKFIYYPNRFFSQYIKQTKRNQLRALKEVEIQNDEKGDSGVFQDQLIEAQLKDGQPEDRTEKKTQRLK